MSPGAHTERAFEDRVEYELLRRGWVRGPRTVQRRAWAFRPGRCGSSSGQTQIKRWDKLLELHGGDQDTAHAAVRVAGRLRDRLARGAGCAAAGGEGPGGADRPRVLPAGAYRWPRTRSMSTTRTCSPSRGSCTSASGIRACRWTWRSSSTGCPSRPSELKNPNTGQNAERRHRPVPAAGPERPVLRQADPRALRGRSRPGVHHHAAEGAGYRVPAVQRRVRRAGKCGRGGEPTARSG